MYFDFRWFCLLVHIKLFYWLRFPIAWRRLLSFWIKPISIWLQNITTCFITPSPIENMAKNNSDSEKSWITGKNYCHFIINFAHSEKYILFTIGVVMSGLGDSRILMIKICFESLFWIIFEIFWALCSHKIKHIHKYIWNN